MPVGIGSGPLGWGLETSGVRDRPAIDPLERRGGARRGVLAVRAWLSWWTGDGFFTTEARLLDIGPGGAALELDELPPSDLLIVFAIKSPALDDGISARLVRIEAGRRAAHRVRLAFDAPCPDDLFRLAVEGFHCAG